MTIRHGTSILGSGDSIADADVIQTANVLGYCFRRMTQQRPLYLDSEGDAQWRVEPPQGKARDAWIKAKRDEYVEIKMLSEMALLVFPLADAYVDHDTRAKTKFAPFKDSFPTIVGGGGDYDEDDPRRLEVEIQRGAASWCRRLGDGPYEEGKMGYRGQGAYTGVVKWKSGEPEYSHFSTTRWTLTKDDAYATRWHPEDNGAIGLMAPLGEREQDRIYGMQGNNQKQRKINQEEFMVFAPPSPRPGDVVGYTHGLPMAVVAVEGANRAGVPLEVVGASNVPEWGDKTKKTSSCFQCAVYLDACGHPPSSIHLGRGESWVPPYPAFYGTDREIAAARSCLKRWYWTCHANLRNGCNILAVEGAVSATHRKSFECLYEMVSSDRWMEDEGQSCAELILDASAIHDKDYLRVIRALWPSSDDRTVRQVKEGYEAVAEMEYPL
jgi:hypothetical protein